MLARRESVIVEPMNHDASRGTATTASIRSGPLGLAALALAVLAPGCRPEPPQEPRSSPPATDPTDTTSAAVAARPLVRPAKLPAVPAEPPAPTAKLPAGAPTGEGELGELVAIDEHRAIVRFFAPGPNHADEWWLALMNRDGSIAWAQTCSGGVTTNSLGPSIEIVGDSVTLVTSHFEDDEPRLELRGFSLADGKPQLHQRLGKGYASGTANDGTRRFDVRLHYDFSAPTASSVTTELVASTGKRVLWRAAIGEPPPPGSDPTVIGDAIVVRVEEHRRGGRGWLAFDRATGHPIGRLPAEPQSCSDGKQWFVMQREAIVAVDPKTLHTREVTGPLELPELPGTWHPRDCAFADGQLVILTSRGLRQALVTYDPKTLERRGHALLGAVYVGLDGFDPLQGEQHQTLTLRTMTRVGADELVVVDPTGKRPRDRWHVIGEHAYLPPVVAWAGGYVLRTSHTLAVVDGRTGMLEGRAVLPEDTSVGSWQIAGHTLWLPPNGPMRLGTRAPRIVDLGATSPEDVRGAVLHDLEPAIAGAEGCPDPTAPLVGSGEGTDGTLGPVERTRLPTWDVDVLHETARLNACAPGTAISRLLAWHVMEDDRPLRNDYALMFVEDHSTKPPRYTLLSMSRHATNLEWSASPGSSHSREEPVRTFDHRPTRAEVDEYLGQTDFAFGDTWGRVIAGNVIDDEWRKALHAEPWRGYAKGIEHPD